MSQETNTTNSDFLSSVHASIGVSSSGKDFVLQRISRPRKNDDGGFHWNVIEVIESGKSAKALIARAAQLGLRLFSAPTEKSRFSMHGDDVVNWEGNIVGKYSEGACFPNTNTETNSNASAATTAQFKPSSVIIFEESDGFHYMDREDAKTLGYLDARGRGYKSRAAAMRSARENHKQND